MKYAFLCRRGARAEVGGGNLWGNFWVGYKVIVVAVIVLSLGQLVISNYLSTMGVRLAGTQGKSARLKEENAVLEAKLDHYYSLNSVAEQGNFGGLAQVGAKVVFSVAKTRVALR